MSEHLSAASQALGVPEALVARSAAARAQATGSTADAVLEAWAGGGSLAVADAPATPAPVAPEPSAPPPSPEPSPEPAASTSPQVMEPEPGARVAPLPAARPTMVAAPLGSRVRVASRTGMLAGGFLGLMAWVFSAQYLLAKSAVTGEDDALRAAIEGDVGRIVVGSMLISVAIGLTVAGLTRLVPSWIDPGMRLTGAGAPTAALGMVLGAAIGGLGGGLVAGLGTPVETLEGVSTIPVMPAVIWSVVVWAGGGWLIGALVQALGVPDGVEPAEAGEVETVRARLISAFGIPVVAALAILTFVLSFAFVFISFPSWAPLTGTVLAAGILGFAALSASKPTMKVGVGELVVAAAGVGVVVLLIYAVLASSGQGHSEEGEAEGEEASVTMMV